MLELGNIGGYENFKSIDCDKQNERLLQNVENSLCSDSSRKSEVNFTDSP
jgi:hypothetical protein